VQATASAEELRRWVDTWKLTGEAIEEQRQRELFNMDEAEAQRRSEDVLSMPEVWRRPGEAGLGMVEQQAWFSRWGHR
jgi:hypothetical protein